MARLNPIDQLPPAAYQHEDDITALKAIASSKVFSWLLRQLIQAGYESGRLHAVQQNNLRVSPAAYPKLNELAQAVAKAIGITCPDLYVFPSAEVSVQLLGVESTAVCVSTEALCSLSESEVASLLSGQFVHIRCGHGPWLMLSDFIQTFSDDLGLAATVLQHVRLQLVDWRKAAMLSSDRGTVLLQSSSDALKGLLFRFAGGSIADSDAWGGVNTTECFSISSSSVSNLSAMGRLLFPHFAAGQCAVYRLGALDEWVNSTRFSELRAGDLSGIDFDENDRQCCSSCVNDQPPLWGAFAGDFEQAEPSDDDDLCACQTALKELRQVASGAGRVAQDGARIAGQAAAVFWDTFQRGLSRFDENGGK